MDRSFYSIITTDDGSSTVSLTEYGEHMHSHSGAYDEALRKHLIPSRILKRIDRSLSVLDIGFGLGYNILALVTEAQSSGNSVHLSIVSFEKDRRFLPILESIVFNDERDALYEYIRKAYQFGHADLGSISITVKIGDARNSVHHLDDNAFHAIFFDPFSPARNPELWSCQFFIEMYRVMKDGGILTTYSSASHVRAAMLEAGFTVGRGPGVGGKREGTLASKGKAVTSLTESEITAILTDYKSAPFRDVSLAADRESIREARRKEIRARKNSSRT